MSTPQARSLPPEGVRGDAWRILSPEADIFIRLSHNLDKVIFRTIAGKLAPYGISQTQALFIIYLSYYTGKPVYQNTLEKTFGLTNPTVTASVRSLIKKGLLYREQDPADGRYFRLYLTEKGKELLVPCLRAFQETNDTLLSKLTVEEEKQLISLYKKMLR